jgi:DNA-binding HxlR family transcriptional regulator
MRFLFRKGAVEAILYLHRVGRAGYYEMLKQGFVVSRETFSILIRELEREGIVARRLIDSRPPRVEYSLTGKGREVAEALSRLDKILRGE